MKKKILIVEDDKDIALAIAIRLRAADFEVINAYDALGGITQAQREIPDLVILDLMMPAGGGLKVAERMRLLPKTATLPIIFLTASKDPSMWERAYQHRPHVILEKPYKSETLLASIHEALGITA